jgi:hypothetical protein
MRRSTSLILVAVLAVPWAFMPIAIAHAAVWISHSAGCSFDLGLASKCIIMGRNWGPDLLHLTMFPMLILVTFLYLPVAAALLLWAWIIRRRAGLGTGQDPRTGPSFWLVCMAGAIAPLFIRTALVLLASAAMVAWWRRRQTG